METLLIGILDVLVEILASFGAGACLLAVLVLFAVGYVLSRRTWRSKRRPKNHLRHILRERIEMDHRLTGALDNLIRAFGCDRAYVTQYHNGGENICGIPFAKCSRTHERIRPGATSQIAALQNLPNSMFAGSNMTIMQDREIFCPDIEILQNSDRLGAYYTMREQGIRSFYLVGMFSFDGVPIGFLGIDFCREARSLSDDRLASLRGYALKLCGMILSEKTFNEDVNHDCLTGFA